MAVFWRLPNPTVCWCTGRTLIFMNLTTCATSSTKQGNGTLGCSQCTGWTNRQADCALCPSWRCPECPESSNSFIGVPPRCTGPWSEGGRRTKVWLKSRCPPLTTQRQKKRGRSTAPLQGWNCRIPWGPIRLHDTASWSVDLKRAGSTKSDFISGICATPSWETLGMETRSTTASWRATAVQTSCSCTRAN